MLHRISQQKIHHLKPIHTQLHIHSVQNKRQIAKRKQRNCFQGKSGKMGKETESLEEL